MTSIRVGAARRLADFVALTKPRVMTLVVFTGLCGLLVAPVASASGARLHRGALHRARRGRRAALNQWYERDIDALMKRTANAAAAGRPDGAGRRSISASASASSRCC